MPLMADDLGAAKMIELPPDRVAQIGYDGPTGLGTPNSTSAF